MNPMGNFAPCLSCDCLVQVLRTIVTLVSMANTSGGGGGDVGGCGGGGSGGGGKSCSIKFHDTVHKITTLLK